MDFVVLDKGLTTLASITPFILYGGMLIILYVISKNNSIS
jgi:hypothetical protein